MDRLSTEELLASLVPAQDGCLKIRADGTILDVSSDLRSSQPVEQRNWIERYAQALTK